MALVVLGGVFALASPSRADTASPGSVAFWYAANPPLAELAQFEWTVLESAHLEPKDVAFLRAQGSEPFAYLSIGEFDGDVQAPGVNLAAGASDVRNQAWNSQVMLLSSSAWQAHLLRRAEALAGQGYAGLFLDTLDSFQLLPETEREEQRIALRDFLAELKRRQPALKLIFNRGFEVLPELSGVASAVAVESIHAGWDANAAHYREVPQADRDWLNIHLDPLRAKGVPLIAIDYLPATQRDQARELAQRLQSEGFVPFVTMPDLNYLGVSSIEVQPRRIAVVYDPREGPLSSNRGHMFLGGLLEYLGYRIDYLAADQLPDGPLAGLYAGVVTWMTSGAPADSAGFDRWLSARIDESVPLAIMAGLPVTDKALLARMGLQRVGQQAKREVRIASRDERLVGSFEAPVVIRLRDLVPLTVIEGAATAALELVDSEQRQYVPIATGATGGIALTPYILEEGPDSQRWILDPFAFLQQALRLPAIPRPDATTENGRRVATVHIDGDGFLSRAEVTGSPYAGREVLDTFIKPHALLTSVSVIEGEIGPKGRYPHLSRELEPIAREIFADAKVEVATHSFSHPFFWQPERARLREGFTADYGMSMTIPGYDTLDFTREVVGSTAYINERLTSASKPVKMIFWTGDALPDAATIKLAYDAGLANVNGGTTILTHARPSLTGLSPLIRPTAGGVQYYAPIINENLYTNLWQGPYYGFRDVLETFELTDGPRRLRGLHLYYHFYSATKQASIRTMKEIYRSMLAEQPISLWMSQYITRMHGLHQASLARLADGRWQIRAMDGLRTMRLDPSLGWPDLARSQGVAGVRDLPQGRYVHLSSSGAVLALRGERDPRPALEQANLPLLGWDYLDENRVKLSFAGEMPLRFSVRAAGRCSLDVAGKRYQAVKADGLWRFDLPGKRVVDAQLLCN
ncbi:bifunctional glycoside hydrolase 114/ polysaccharide deacetylase family protein [Pseudomonas zhaodongensis]|nr:bifunctional glycoside hydrolase 114/ polysaccharide deacetylase family protein [Stutzerimonas zhaodongensis]MCQ2028111.1 bifunctional glycoside hydrolase 114/ polysaccharide deacetylase family protein [Stutzerimonas zhaodongensis]